uniref:Thioredoxin domain-containing protein n=1 Tax=Lutzomyia longipalpis TaxID=7200 RepID=A0A1B0CKN5_LUTLO
MASESELVRQSEELFTTIPMNLRYETKMDDASKQVTKRTKIFTFTEKQKKRNSLTLCRRYTNFGRRYDWADNFKMGLSRAKQEDKPLMMVIHATGCPACRKLKTDFASDKKLLELSKNFVMLNTEDDEEPKARKFQIDGLYFPRILFFSPCGKVLKEVINEKRENEDCKYYYSTAMDITKSMQKVLKMYRK